MTLLPLCSTIINLLFHLTSKFIFTDPDTASGGGYAPGQNPNLAMSPFKGTTPSACDVPMIMAPPPWTLIPTGPGLLAMPGTALPLTYFDNGKCNLITHLLTGSGMKGIGMNPMRGLIDWIKTGPGPKPPPWDSGAGAKEVARAGMLAGGGGGGGGSGSGDGGNPGNSPPDPHSGHPTGGNPHGGNPGSGNPNGGNLNGGHPNGGHPNGGNPNGGHPNNNGNSNNRNNNNNNSPSSGLPSNALGVAGAAAVGVGAAVAVGGSSKSTSTPLNHMHHDIDNSHQLGPMKPSVNSYDTTIQECGDCHGKYSNEGAAREWSTVVIVIVIFIS